MDDRLREHRRKGEGCDPGTRGSFLVAKKYNRKGQSVAQHSELKGQSMAQSGKYGLAESDHFSDYTFSHSPSEPGGKGEKINILFSLSEPWYISADSIILLLGSPIFFLSQ